jgi:hypothetical protein
MGKVGRLLAATQLEAKPADQPAMMAGIQAGNEIGGSGSVAQMSSPRNSAGPNRRGDRRFDSSIRNHSHYHIELETGQSTPQGHRMKPS